ncbi:MAG: phosphoribosylaminoimidazolesuccinocarboxamide synthase [Phycisphaerales bacterium]|nr:phosphoribosylaminoimidazolesuccinocarboxamide synthase [Phycisphaerales bacterium]
MDGVFETDLGLPGRRRGKVRDVYDAPPGTDGSPRLLVVATDRISAFDVVMPTPIPGKGRILTDISLRWFSWLERQGIVDGHVLGADTGAIPGLTVVDRAMLAGRAMLVRRCRVVPIECVVRGYLEGSGWSEYQRSGAVCGVPLPSGLRRGDRLPEPIFTPATKEEAGKHDENITFDRASAIAGGATMEFLRRASVAVYRAAHAYALERGVILADTKFEFGFPLDRDGRDAADRPILVDEVLTPDSSRYWPADRWMPGAEQESFDKQYLREWLNTLVSRGLWNKQAPGPALPAHVVAGTAARYEEARRRLFG